MKFSLKEYNTEQMKAVTHTNGPMLVISGAGTGKTRILTGRMLYLILKHQIPASSILALTFTEKATQEMIQRTTEELPLGSEEPVIRTFHSFAEMILRERGHEIGLSTDFVLMNEAETWMFLRRHILALKLEYYRPLGNAQKFLRDIHQYFGRLQDEDISPEKYLQYCEGQLGAAKTPEDKELAERHLELAGAYRRYQSLLLKEARLDFGSLLFQSLRLFEKRLSVLKEYQDRFSWILVDEFQDTNFAQNKLVTLLASRHRNLFIVGDDDQSIYKWRGASLTNSEYFERHFPEAEKMVLNANYRSHQGILDLAYAVIQRNNPRRLEITQRVSKRLFSPKPRHGGAKKMSAHHFSSVDQEVAFVVQEAEKALTACLDTAILVRTNVLGNFFLEHLKKRDLPFQHFASDMLFEKPVIKDLIAVLRVITNPWDDMALFRLLSHPLWGISVMHILELNRDARMRSQSVFACMREGVFTFPKKVLGGLIEASRKSGTSELLGKFLNESGYLEWAKGEPSADESLSLLANFSERVKQFEMGNPGYTVSDFLMYIQMLQETGDRSSQEIPLDVQAIKILTIHGSKGLEFDAVFLPGMVQGKFPAVSRRASFEIPAELLPEELPEADHHLEEERRLFYVALTRARKFVTISYSDFYDGKKQWKPSVFLAEAEESGFLRAENLKKKLMGKKPKKTEPLGLLARPQRSLTLDLPKLSYSQLDTFRTCPLKYQFRYLFRVQTPMPPVVNFGTSIHNTLHAFYKALQDDPSQVEQDPLSLLLKFYSEKWISAGYETPALMEDQKKRGEMMLRKFLSKEMQDFRIPSFLEHAFTLPLQSITISGRIDRMDKLPDGTYEVIDYKTGSSKDKNLDKDLQLSIYALACRDVLKLPVSRLSLYFLDSLEKISTIRTPLSLEKCENEIIELAKEMAASEFEGRPGYHCRYCDFRLICPIAATQLLA